MPAETPPRPNAGDVALRRYYAARAAEYERIYHKPERQAGLRRLESMLPPLFAGRHVLEIACGTGWWTPHGAHEAAGWLATDVNDETLAIARAKPMPPAVRFARMDAWTFEGLGGRAADAASTGTPFTSAFAGFWWSHVPLERLPSWLERLHTQLAPGARVVFLDNRYVEGSSTPIARRDAAGNEYQQRRLDDGSVHEVLKNFPTREQALAAIGERAVAPRWTALDHYWLLDYTLA